MVKNEVKTTGSLASAAVRSLAERMRAELEKALGPAAFSITVRLSGTLEDLKVDFSGPEAMVAKAKKALGLK